MKQRHWPGASKWNRVEHRLFSFISINWRGRPLTHYQVILEVIGNTSTATGLAVTSSLGTNDYPTGIKIGNAEFATVPLPHTSFIPNGTTERGVSPERVEPPQLGHPEPRPPRQIRAR